MVVDKLHADAAKRDRVDVSAATDVDNRVCIFNDTILKLFSDHAPTRRIKLKRAQVPWMLEVIRAAMSRRDHSFLRFKKDRCE